MSPIQSLLEDLLHEIFLKALAANEKGNKPVNLSGWLYTIARNTVTDFYRTKRPMDELADDLIADAADSNIEKQLLAACLRPMTMLLPPIYRDTLLATGFDGKTLRSLANKSNISESALKSRASRARKMLKEKLLACCYVEVSCTGEILDFHDQNSTHGCSAQRENLPNHLRECGKKLP